MSRPPKPPEPITVDPWRAAVRANLGKKDERWLWRAIGPRIDGRRREVSLGRITRLEARARLLELAGESPDPRAQSERPTGFEEVQHLIRGWLAHVKVTSGEGSQTYQTYHRRARLHLKTSSLWREPIEALRLGVLEDYMVARLRAGAAGSTIEAELNAVRAAWTWGRRRAIVDDVQLKLPRVPDTGRVYNDYNPTDGEVAAVAGWLDDRPPNRGRRKAIWQGQGVRGIWAWGLRIGELATLRRDRVVLWPEAEWQQDGVWRGMAEVHGKSGMRRVPVIPAAWDVIVFMDQVAPWAGGEDYVMRTRPSAVRTLKDSIADACEALGQPRWSPQSIRRSVVDRLYATTGPKTAAAILGHSMRVAWKHYRRVRPEEMAGALGAARLPRGQVIPLKTEGSG